MSINEMMVQFSGSVHTVKKPNKPIEGYKIFALCDHGYTYSFEFYSRVQGATCLLSTSPTPRKLTPTSQACLRLKLVGILPYT